METPDTDSPLHKLLIKACPPNAKGHKSIPVLAMWLGMTKWNIYKWIKRGRLPPNRAEEIVALANGRVTLDEFFPFIFKSAA